MCYSVAYLEKKMSKLVSRYENLLPQGWSRQLLQDSESADLPVYYFVSGFSHPKLPVITAGGVVFCTWGLIPFWTKNEVQAQKLRSATLNAVGETAFEKPSFRRSIRSKRCLLPVNGFFEWRDFHGKKYPYFIHKEDKALFSLGCIFDEWANPCSGEIIHTFSIITTPANPLLEIIHNRKRRMPLILSGEHEEMWIDASLTSYKIKRLLLPNVTEKLMAYTVSRDLNFSRNERNSPKALEIIDYNELEPI